MKHPLLTFRFLKATAVEEKGGTKSSPKPS